MHTIRILWLPQLSMLSMHTYLFVMHNIFYGKALSGMGGYGVVHWSIIGVWLEAHRDYWDGHAVTCR